MEHAVLLELHPTVRDFQTGQELPGAPETVWEGAGAYTPAGTRAAALAAARGTVATGVLRLPLDAIVYPGLTAYVTGEGDDGEPFAAYVRVTATQPRPGRRVQQIATVEDVVLDAETPA